VNFVNAPLIAPTPGIEVEEERRALTRGYTNLLRVTVHRNGERVEESRARRSGGTTALAPRRSAS
jgi:hypothetical protein